MLQPDNVTVVGHVSKSHGFKGELKVTITHTGAEDLETEWVFLMIDQKPVPFFVEDIRFSGQSNWILKLEDVDTETEADKLKGIEVAVSTDILPDEDPTPAQMIMNFEVIDEQHGHLGKITDFLDHGFQQLLKIETEEGREVMIPFVDQIVLGIDPERQEIRVNLPEGLLDVNN